MRWRSSRSGARSSSSPLGRDYVLARNLITIVPCCSSCSRSASSRRARVGWRRSASGHSRWSSRSRLQSSRSTGAPTGAAPRRRSRRPPRPGRSWSRRRSHPGTGRRTSRVSTEIEGPATVEEIVVVGLATRGWLRHRRAATALRRPPPPPPPGFALVEVRGATDLHDRPLPGVGAARRSPASSWQGLRLGDDGRGRPRAAPATGPVTPSGS